jgi:hypothetical protein
MAIPFVAVALNAARVVGSRILKKGLKSTAKKAYKMAEPHVKKGASKLGDAYKKVDSGVKKGTNLANKKLNTITKKGSTYYTKSSVKAKDAAEKFNKGRGHTKKSIKANDAAIEFNKAIKKGSKVKKKVVPKLVKVPKRVVPKRVRVKNPTAAHLKNPGDKMTRSAKISRFVSRPVRGDKNVMQIVGSNSQTVTQAGLYSLYKTATSPLKGRSQSKQNKARKKRYQK